MQFMPMHTALIIVSVEWRSALNSMQFQDLRSNVQFLWMARFLLKYLKQNCQKQNTFLGWLSWSAYNSVTIYDRIDYIHYWLTIAFYPATDNKDMLTKQTGIHYSIRLTSRLSVAFTDRLTGCSELFYSVIQQRSQSSVLLVNSPLICIYICLRPSIHKTCL